MSTGRELVPANEFPLATKAGGAWAQSALRQQKEVGTPSSEAEAPDTASNAADSPALPGQQSQANEGAEAPGDGGPPADGFVRGEGYWQGRNIPADDRAGYDYLATTLHASNVRREVGGAAVDWLQEAAKLGESLRTQSEAAAHVYDTSGYRFTGEDRPVLNHFLNAMHRKGATQAEVEALLNLYVDGQKRAAKREAARDRPSLGASYQTERRGDSREPDAERELEQIRTVMRTDRQRYNRDEKMQARYRELVAARGNN